MARLGLEDEVEPGTEPKPELGPLLADSVVALSAFALTLDVDVDVEDAEAEAVGGDGDGDGEEVFLDRV